MERNESKNEQHVRATQISRDLVRRIIAGDVSAEAEAWTRYDASIRKLARIYADCEDDVNDCVSMTWEIALPKLRAGELKNTSALGCYLRGIVRSVALGELRKRPWLTICGDNDYLDQCLVDQTTPFDVVAREQALEVAMTVIDDLNVARDREIIVLEFFDEAEREQMCESYDVSPLQMSRWVSRARTRVRKHPAAAEALALAMA